MLTNSCNFNRIIDIESSSAGEPVILQGYG